MTARQFFGMLMRRWYVVALVICCTAASLAIMPRETGVYWTKVNVIFVPPYNPARPGNVLEGSDESLIYFAAAIERQVNGGARSLQLSSSEATLYGAGVKKGHTVTLPNAGGQWQTNFNRPMLTVEVVDSSADRTRSVATTVTEQVESLVSSQQAAVGAAPESFIRTQLSPAEPAVTYVGGSWTRAAAVVSLLGLGSALACAFLVDRWSSRRRRRLGAPRLNPGVPSPHAEWS